ncbi:MAG TPA: acyl-ACP--UDP-N-acetylglucosamine O-acyltransferase [Kiritimatiellia bacterium]|nr:acyl-ACP--UDP-N-acetylglucosamine O-acyltransferase [Kiritimatiellia bacterium]
MAIHPTAIVDPSARIGSDVDLGPHAVIGPEVALGDGCRIGPHVVIVSHTRLGDRCMVHAHAVLGDTPQDLAFRGAVSWVEIGADVTIREGVTINRGTKEGTVTQVGDGCFLMANSHLAHNVALGRRVILANGALLAGYVEVADAAFISGNAVVHQFCRVGRLAMIAGGAVITKDVPPFCTTHSDHRNTVAGLNIVGMRRAGLGSEDRLHVKRAFGLLYRGGLTPAQAADRIDAELPEGPARELSAFLRGGTRGVCSFVGGGSDDAG